MFPQTLIKNITCWEIQILRDLEHRPSIYDFNKKIAYLTDINISLELASSSQWLGEDCSAVAVRIVVDDVQRVVERVSLHQDEHGAEDLFLVDTHVGGNTGQDGGANKVTLLVARRYLKKDKLKLRFVMRNYNIIKAQTFNGLINEFKCRSNNPGRKKILRGVGYGEIMPKAINSCNPKYSRDNS